MCRLALHVYCVSSETIFDNMVSLNLLTSHRGAVLFFLLLPSALSVPYYDSTSVDGEVLQLYEVPPLEEPENSVIARRGAELSGSSWPAWHPARRHLRTWSGDTRKRYLPYHPVVRFRSPKPDFMDYPILSYSRRYEDRLKKNLSAGEILALLSTIMVDRASQGRLKGLRFGISKR
ncbi:uncharacterized protein [Periplaneta americana]|uniref:uncharacterized protein n=1 Tax=Periplaneta americana TaxID=6978 RepID=UPI0037E9B97D